MPHRDAADQSLPARRRRATLRSCQYFLLGSVGTIAAVAATLAPAFPTGELAGCDAVAAWSRILLPEAFGLLGFTRFGWWLSHLKAIDGMLAGHSHALVDEAR